MGVLAGSKSSTIKRNSPAKEGARKRRTRLRKGKRNEIGASFVKGSSASASILSAESAHGAPPTQFGILIIRRLMNWQPQKVQTPNLCRARVDQLSTPPGRI